MTVIEGMIIFAKQIAYTISFWTLYGWKMYDDFSLSFLPNAEVP